MHEISKDMRIEMGHRLPHHNGKCSNLHGHGYYIEIFVRGELQTSGPEEGMIVDYYKLKEAMKVIDGLFDHKMCLHYADTLVPFLIGYEPLPPNKEYQTASLHGRDGQNYILVNHPPTAEVLAELWFMIIADRVPGVFKIVVKETATSTATYQV